MSTATVATVNLTGKSGTKYTFEVYPKRTKWANVPGVYIILRDNGARWGTIYAGETEDLAARMDSHHKMPCFDRQGWTHLGFRHEPSGSRRLAIERDLQGAGYPWPCND